MKAAAVKVLHLFMHVYRCSSGDPVVQSEHVAGAGPADDAALFCQQHDQLPVSDRHASSRYSKPGGSHAS